MLVALVFWMGVKDTAVGDTLAKNWQKFSIAWLRRFRVALRRKLFLAVVATLSVVTICPDHLAYNLLSKTTSFEENATQIYRATASQIIR